MFWIVDSILMRKISSDSKMPSVHYHKSDAKYDKLKPELDSCSDCEVTVHAQATARQHRTELEGTR